MKADELVDVHLLRLPVPVWARAQEQSEALQREFSLLGAEPHEVPARLLEVIAALQAQYGEGTTAQQEQLYGALDAGVEELPALVFRVPRAVGAHAQVLARILDEADDHCRSGENLLTLAADEEVVAFRHWYLGQFHDQAEGGPAVAWPDRGR